MTTSTTTQPRTVADPSQLAALELMQSGHNVFLTGVAGSGKSYVVRQHIGRAFDQPEITASTGIAAINLQNAFLAETGIALRASTVYRWAGIAIGPKPHQSFEEYFRLIATKPPPSRINAFNRVYRAKCLLIDEISMIPGRILDYLDYHCRQLRNDDRPFGGIQIIAVGDFLQLPPVSKNGTYDWAFLSNSWQGADFQPAVLTHIHRQADPAFINALNDFREGRIRGSTARLLANRVARFPSRNITRLLTHNTQVDKWNAYQLENIEKPAHTFTGEESGPQDQIDYLWKNSITPRVLTLKEGARIMVTRNLSQDGELIAANGATGTVIAIGDEAITVDLDNIGLADIHRTDFQFDPFDPDSAAVTQYPLRPAYAMTIHKSQGLTLDRALIDIRAAREPGQAYVALSRLRSLTGLHLKDWIRGVFVSNEAISFHRNLTSPSRGVGACSGPAAQP
ncbi:MAG: AAA family ATPase [Opitutales bacterium]|nr:AAA family ATPase [Opitutales bacterium]